MPIINHTIIRGGVPRDIEKGVNTDLSTRVNITETIPDATYSQQYREAPLEVRLKFDRSMLEGELVAIEVIWGKAMLSNSGVPISDTLREHIQQTSETHRKYFILKFKDILDHLINGEVCAELAGNRMGWSTMPVYDTSGNIIVYTTEQEETPADNLYNNPPIV